ncbi:hypothetical protein HU765_09710 [Pseudomonas sp. SWRI81]|uniref:hypothetical protein n=1 Tax=Pseudomonas sp. SWRI81 TaxID=2745505 RepID=UPI0016447880|nr:hypothetical protein [Pseudomonas sp. SWRI81]MBC3270202.1 hypothetical protein [Pseudomonas sp. SWRI81]
MSASNRETSTEHVTDQPERQLHIEDQGDGLTDDQRASREQSDRQDGARVKPGPADQDRQAKR